MCAAITQSIGLSKSRIEALTDGIFATLMTILVLGLRLDVGIPLPRELSNIQPNILAYAMSFVVLGVYWVGHHNLFHYVRGSNRVFLWLNMIFLMAVGFIPFTTSLLGAYFLEQYAVVIYGFNLMLPGVSLYLIWWYATNSHHLVDPDIDPHVVSSVKRRILTGPILYLIAIVFAFLAPTISMVLYIAALCTSFCQAT